MSKITKDIKTSKQEILDHKPAPGYRSVFHIVVGVTFLYLIFIFASGL